MTLFNSIQNIIFGKKKSKHDIVENDALGKITPVAASAQVEKAVSENTGSEGEITAADLQRAIELQKEQVEKIKKTIKEHKKHFVDYEKSKKILTQNKRELEKQKKEYSQLAKRPDLVPQHRKELRKALQEIEKALAEIKDNGKKNEAFIVSVKDVIKDSEKAVRVNEKALDKNEQAWQAVRKSDGAVKIQARDIEELERQVEQEDLVSGSVQDAVVQDQNVQSSTARSQEVVSPDVLRSAKEQEDDYWEKGEIQEQ